MSKESDNLKNSLKQKLMKLEQIMKNILQHKKTMNYQLTKYKNWNNSSKEKEEQQWHKMNMPIEKFSKCKDKTDNLKIDSKEEKVIWINTKVKIKSWPENTDNLKSWWMKWEEKATWMKDN